VRPSVLARFAISIGVQFGKSLDALRGCHRNTSIMSRHMARVTARAGVSRPRTAKTTLMVVW